MYLTYPVDFTTATNVANAKGVVLTHTVPPGVKYLLSANRPSFIFFAAKESDTSVSEGSAQTLALTYEFPAPRGRSGTAAAPGNGAADPIGPDIRVFGAAAGELSRIADETDPTADDTFSVWYHPTNQIKVYLAGAGTDDVDTFYRGAGSGASGANIYVVRRNPSASVERQEVNLVNKGAHELYSMDSTNSHSMFRFNGEELNPFDTLEIQILAPFVVDFDNNAKGVNLVQIAIERHVLT